MGWETSDRREHLPPNWRSLRRQCFSRDGYRCVAILSNGLRCKEVPTECDHIGDRDDHRLEMLQSLCEFHHGKKTGQQGAAAKWKAKRRIESKFFKPESHPGAID